MSTSKTSTTSTSSSSVAPLSPEGRLRALDEMAGRELDVLVVGGGVVGAGSALDAATRGLDVALVEARDWASGTSSRSSKLIHGGLRYLEMLDFALVREALRERGLMVQKLAPHLVRPVPFLYPLQHRAWERPYVGAGVMLYDTMGVSSGNARGLPHHRHLSKKAALRIAPALRSDSLVGAVQYYDAQVDDARHTVTIVRTAAAHGALVANRTSVTELLREGDRVVGAVLRDEETGRTLEVRAKVVLNATGVWTDETQALVGGGSGLRVRASKGIHLLVPREKIDLDTGLILRTEKSVLFVIPWGRQWIIGTTDTDWTLDKAHPAASASDITYLLEHVNSVLKQPISREDILGVYAGLRPLLAGESDSTSKLSREHVVARPAPGLVVVAGGKYTTYRVMAEDAVDMAVEQLGQVGVTGVPASVTRDVPLVGADGYAAAWNARVATAHRYGLTVEQVEHLLQRYGSKAAELLDLLAADPSLGQVLAGTEEYLRVEALYAATHEGARHLDDVLARRTRASIETPSRGVDAAREVAELVAPVLGWSAADVDREVEIYTERVRAERASQEQPDDTTADAVRLTAPEPVPVRVA
ncbi:MAG: glycerol-3-phosphate dehydrogenase/oxidase [Motilibacteraceae bacterium]